MLHVDDIKELHLDLNIRYLVKDNIRCRRFECILVFQADFVFLFEITDPKVLDKKICITKVDYYLNNNLINAADFQKTLRT